MNRPLLGVAIVLCLLAGRMNAQDGQWWSDNVGWDGVTPYQAYLNLTTRGMGPNALPPPALHGAWLDTLSSLRLGVNSFLTRGEVTVSGLIDLRWQPTPLFRFRAWVVPLEWFRSSHALKTDRKIHFLSYDRQWAGGDICVESSFRLPATWLPFARTEFRAGIKTASGTAIGAARYTDTPGYSFDLSLSRPFGRDSMYGVEVMAGFLAYQTYDPQHRQDDAPFGGLGFWRVAGAWLIQTELTGYWGYFGTGDRPLILSAEVGYQPPERRLGFLLQAGLGLHDWPFTRFGILCHYRLGPFRNGGLQTFR